MAAGVLWYRTQAEKCEAETRDLRLEVHKLEAQVQLEVSRSSRYRTLWELATGRPVSEKSSDAIPASPSPSPNTNPGPDPPPVPRKDPAP